MHPEPRTRQVTVYTKNGSKTVQTAIDMPTAILVLEEIVEGRGDQTRFEQSLIETNRRYGLTDKQAAWALVLAQGEIDRRAAPDEPKPERPTKSIGDLSAIIRLIHKAAESLAYPKIRLKTDSGRTIQVAQAGPKSRYYGDLMITDGRPFGASTYYGRVDQDGLWHGQPDMDDVLDLLEEFALDPSATAARYGQLTGNCCFCKRALEDERSTRVGYGPVCAENYGLPWGEKDATEGDEPPKPKKARTPRKANLAARLHETAIAEPVADPCL